METKKQLKRHYHQQHKGANMEEKKTIRQQLEDIQGDICDNFCKYRNTCDENNECDWVREGNSCPLDKI